MIFYTIIILFMRLVISIFLKFNIIISIHKSILNNSIKNKPHLKKKRRKLSPNRLDSGMAYAHVVCMYVSV